jgi:ADP-ribose diphosphatase
VNEVVDIEVVEDRTADAKADEGFLRVRRLRVRNRYADGTASAPYACDVVSRRHVDAVAVVLYERAGRTVRVALREGLRPPVTLRREKDVADAATAPLRLAEIVAGVLEEGEADDAGVARRAVREVAEEAGLAGEAAAVRPLGGPLFPSPGVTDERVLFRALETDLDARGTAPGDGSAMEEGATLLLLPLREAIRRCRCGGAPDMKTEVALLRLCDLLGYLPALDRFLDDLPPEERARAAALPPLL